MAGHSLLSLSSFRTSHSCSIRLCWRFTHAPPATRYRPITGAGNSPAAQVGERLSGQGCPGAAEAAAVTPIVPLAVSWRVAPGSCRATVDRPPLSAIDRYGRWLLSHRTLVRPA